MAHTVGRGCGQQGDAREARVRPTLHTLDPGHGQARRVHAVQAAGAQGVARLYVGIAGHEAQLHPGVGAPACAAEGRAALLRAVVDHRNGGVAVGQQRDLGREGVDTGHLAQHPGLVDHG